MFSKGEDGSTKRMDILPFEASVIILPKRWPVKTEQAMIHKCMGWANKAICKAAWDSLWWVEGKETTVYAETTLKIKRKRHASDGSHHGVRGDHAED